MSHQLGQTDNNAACGVVQGCSGNSVTGGTPHSTELVDGAATGTTAETITINSDESSVIAYAMQTINNVPNDTTWEAGDWVVRINVTTGNMDVDWVRTEICRFNSSCVNQETVGTDTTSTNLANAGVKSVTVAGSAVTAAATDEVYIILSFTDNNSEHTPAAETFAITPDQVIDSPILIPSVSSGTGWVSSSAGWF